MGKFTMNERVHAVMFSRLWTLGLIYSMGFFYTNIFFQLFIQFNSIHLNWTEIELNCPSLNHWLLLLKNQNMNYNLTKVCPRHLMSFQKRFQRISKLFFFCRVPSVQKNISPPPPHAHTHTPPHFSITFTQIHTSCKLQTEYSILQYYIQMWSVLYIHRVPQQA